MRKEELITVFGIMVLIGVMLVSMKLMMSAHSISDRNEVVISYSTLNPEKIILRKDSETKIYIDNIRIHECLSNLNSSALEILESDKNELIAIPKTAGEVPFSCDNIETTFIIQDQQ